MKKRLLSFVMTICMVVGMMPAVGISASAATPSEVFVGDTNVVAGSPTYWLNNAGGITGLGASEENYNVKYDPATGTLTLSGAAISGETAQHVRNDTDYSAIFANGGDLNIVLNGDNSIEGGGTTAGNSVRSIGLQQWGGALNITGTGTLRTIGADMTGTDCGSYGLYSIGRVTIQGGATVISTGGNQEGNNSASIGVITGSSGTINITNSTLSAISGTVTTVSGSTGYSRGMMSGYGAHITITNSAVSAVSGDAPRFSTAMEAYNSDISISGGTLTVTCGESQDSRAIQGYSGTSLIITSGGAVTASCSSSNIYFSAKAIVRDPDLENYGVPYKITASRYCDGSNPTTYDPLSLSYPGYSYFKIEEKSAAPAASITSVDKSNTSQANIDFELTSAPAGTYHVYADNTATTEHSTVTAAVNENVLTLTDSGGNVGSGTYYVAVTETGKGESDRLALTVVGLPTISINDVTINEGNSGPAAMIFTVSLDRTWENSISVAYATEDLTAMAGSDYTATSGTVTFSPGTTTQAISVPVYGDILDEDNETFQVYLYNAPVGVSISDSSGIGTIIDDDDAPSISISDSSVTEGNSGTATMTFTVSLSGASGKTVTVDYATANGTANVGSDYPASSGTLTFAPGETAKTISVIVNGDTIIEPGETVYVNLSNSSNAIISDNQGIGTIVNDDLAAEVIPSATTDYTNEKLTGLTPSADYTVNGTDKTADENGKIAIENSWFGTTISLVKKGVGTTTTNSAAQSIALAARPATPACTAIQPTASSATGTVSGISTLMEYSTDGGSSWVGGTGSDISGLAPGTALVRVKATGSAPASLSQTIVISAYSAPPTSGGGGSSSGSSTPTLITKIDSGNSLTGTNLDRLVKEGKTLTVEDKTGKKLVFDTEALKNIGDQTNDSLKVEIKDVSADHASKHPGKLVVSLTATAGGKNISNFGKGTATISLPYVLKPGEKPEDVTVWYLAEDGTMSEVPCSYDSKTQMATFKVNHFSLYLVGTDALRSWMNPFSDVKESSWFYEAVRFVSANKLMQGTTDTTFDPKGKTTRGMIVTTLWRMENQPKATKTITFNDVKSGKYYHDAVVWAAEQGIVSGYSADKFGPEDKITREQLAVILQNYAAIKGYKTSTAVDLSAFSDAGAIHKWGKEAMAWANGEGLINGTGNNLLDPAGAAERGQVAAILQRLIESTII